MTDHLRQDEIVQLLATLRPALTGMQVARLETIAELLGDDGRFRLSDVLDAAEFPGQDAFADFRKKVNTAAATAGVDMVLELESRKVTPARRFGWFAGGDLVDAGIASFAGAAADRTGITHPVSPVVAEILPAPRVHVYVSHAPHRAAAGLIQEIERVLAVDRDRSWTVSYPGWISVGDDATTARDELAASADIRVVLLTIDYLRDDERRRGLDAPGRTVVCALGGLPDGSLDLGPLARHDVRRRDTPWIEVQGEKNRRSFVGELVDALHRELDRTPPEPGDEPLTVLSTRLAHRRRKDDSCHLVHQDAGEISLRESRLDTSDPTAGPPQAAVDRLVEWASTTNGPQLCALLGDVGMGKTTTAKLLTRRLLDLRAGGQKAPLPILFDLRDVQITGLDPSITLDRILNGMLDATRPPGVDPDRLNAGTVRRRLTEGDTVVVFDGLDEVLVHLSPHDQRVFTRQLWRAVEGGSARMLVTCRTQYFRTIRDEVSCFVGEERQGLRGEHYLALLMQPFRPDQVREYLAANVGRDGEWVEDFLETIAGVHDLIELSGRPLTLRLIADQVEFIETSKLAGRTVQSVDLYGEVVERWLARDGGKHTLEPEHKRLLMEEIAAGMWRSGRNSWDASEVDAWLLDLLDRRPDLSRHYRARVPDLWKADFRTATFLSRDRGDDTFAFGHRSLFEYFLARYLFRSLVEVGTKRREPEGLAMPVPSRETLEFLGQSLAGASEPERSSGLAGLDRTRTPYRSQVSELTLAYALHAGRRGLPRHSLRGVGLAGADLSGWTVGTNDATTALSGADLSGADLRWARLYRVDLSDADLTRADFTGAEVHGSTLSSALTVGARMVGTVLRECAIEDVHWDDVDTYRTELLQCRPQAEPRGGLLVAPLPAADRSATTDVSSLRVLALRDGTAESVAWSPDGTRVCTGSDGDSAEVWDAITGTVLHLLTGRTRTFHSVAWSSDGTRLLTGGRDGARVWDATTGKSLHQFGEHTSWVYAVAWSPDGTRLLVGGDAGACVWDAATGAALAHLAEHTGVVQSVAWSPDSTRLLTGSSDGARIWDAITGTAVHHLSDHTDWVGSVAWSPDGTQVLTGSDDGSARIWDAIAGTTLHHITDHAGWVYSVAWSPDGTRFFTSSDDGARIWDSATITTVEHFAEHTGVVQSVVWSPDGTRLLTGSSDGARIWDTTTSTTAHHLTHHTGLVESVAYSPDGTRLLTGGRDGTRVWDITSGAILHRLIEPLGFVQSVAWSPDGTRLLTGSSDGARIWDATTGTTLRHLTDHTDWVRSVAWSPDGTRLLTGSDDGSARIWDTTGTTLHHLTDHPGWVYSVAWSPDGTRLVTGSEDGARIWDTTTGTALHHLANHTDCVYSVAWSPDGTRLLTGSSDGTRIWDTTGTTPHKLAEHSGVVESVAWSPDGTRFLTGSDDGCRVWDATTGTTLHHITHDTGVIRSVAWCPDGIRVLTSGGDGSARIWDVRTGRPTGVRPTLLPDGQVAVFDNSTDGLIGASAGAWRWLGWNALRDGWITRIPAESFGPLPPMPTAGGKPSACLLSDEVRAERPQ